MPDGQGPGCAHPSQNPFPVLLHGLWAGSWLFQLCPGEALSHKPASSRTVAGACPKLCLCSHFPGKGQDGCTESRASRPGQVLCTLPRPLCQRKHKHPTQRKHFSSAAQVPIFAQGWSVPGSFPHHTAGLWPEPPFLPHRNQALPPRPALERIEADLV